jgi:hypothetical protein
MIKKEEPPKKLTHAFTVIVDDLYYQMDEEHRYTAGEFDSWEEAVAEAKRVVYENLQGGDTPDEAMRNFMKFSMKPTIINNGILPDGECFNSMAYLETCIKEMFEERKKRHTGVRTGKPLYPGRPIGRRTVPLSVTADRIAKILVKNLNANVLKDNPEKSTSSEEINKNGKKE